MRERSISQYKEATVSKTARDKRVFCEKGVLSYFAKFTGKQLCQSLFFNEILKKDSNTGVLLVNFVRNF